MRGWRGLVRTARLGEVENGRENNLNLIRFALASAVIYSHAYLLPGVATLADEPMMRLTGVFYLGNLAVFSFFFLSGYLILKSGLRTLGPEEFLAARTLRIFPALAVAVLACAFVLGPMVTTLPLRDYFSAPLLRTFVSQMWLHRVAISLPGVFMDGRAFTNVDGVIWTLPIEWTMYVLTLVVSVGVRWRTMRVGVAGWVAIAGAVLLTAQMLPFNWGECLPWMKYFCLGAVCFVVRRSIPLSLPVAVAGLGGVLGLMRMGQVGMGLHLFPLALGYGLLSLGFHPSVHVRGFHRFGDYSYGLYVYAYPLQQMMLRRIPQPVPLFVASYLPTLVLAVASWHWLEEPCLRLKGRVRVATADTGVLRCAQDDGVEQATAERTAGPSGRLGEAEVSAGPG